MLKTTTLSLLKKTSIAAVVMTMGSMAHAVMDWKEVIELAPYSTPVAIDYDEKGYISLEGVQLPNGRFRLNDIRTFMASRKPRLYVDLPMGIKDLEKQCKTAIDGKKPFKAILKFTVNPMLQPGTFSTSVKVTPLIGERKTTVLPSVEFDNPYTLGPVKIEFSKFAMQYSREPNDPEYGQLWWMIKDYYLNLLNSKIPITSGADITVDLSTMNGFACDLMLGKIQIKATQTATYFPGAATRYDWIYGEDLYLQIFKAYWKDETLYFGENSKAVSPEDSAFLLGYQHRFPLENSLIFITQDRLGNLIRSLSFNLESLSSAEKDQLNMKDLARNFYMTSSFTTPNYPPDAHQELVIIDDEAFTTTLSEMK